MFNLWKILYGVFAVGVGSLIFFLYQKEPLHLGFDFNNTKETHYLQGEILAREDNFFRVILQDSYHKTQQIEFQSDPDFLFHAYKVGDKVTLYQIVDESGVNYDLVDYVHLDGLVFLFLIFAGITIWVAQRKGFFSIVSLLFSTTLFYFIFLRGILVGYTPLQACLIFVVAITILTIPLIHGFNRKSASSLIAINLGYLFSFLLVFLFKSFARIGAKSSESLRNLAIQIPEIDLGEVLLVILFLGAIGALIDISVTISSAIFEAHKKNQFTSLKSSFSLGMEVGKDVLGSMVNTLLLAYLASSVPFFILVSFDQNGTLSELLNYDFIALEITRTLIGALSLVILIPLTAAIASWMLSHARLKSN